MPYTEKQFPFVLLSTADAESLRDEYQDAIDAQAGTQVAYALNVSAGIAFIIPAAQVANYAAANQAKKEVMAAIYQETVASAEPFDAYYNARYLELYP
jgi:hypothetical protein